MREALSFDDVMLVPQFSSVSSRANVDVSTRLVNTKLKHPIIPANMKSIMGFDMAYEIVKSGGLAILHRFATIEEQLKLIQQLKILDPQLTQVAVSVGVKDVALHPFLNAGVKNFCIDIAHGDSQHCVDMIKKLKEHNVTVIAGNVATGDAARRLWSAGADVVKVGVGNGKTCSTRLETGNGVPQITALMDVYEAKLDLQQWLRTLKSHNRNKIPQIISDGGIVHNGDFVKALCFSDMVMAGAVFAGCVETPGDTLVIDGKTCKQYAGSSTHKLNHVEGVVTIVPTTNNFADILRKAIEAIQSGCSYQGVTNLYDLKSANQFVKISNAGLKESHPRF